jgi:hemerythrin-like domain-containing protein
MRVRRGSIKERDGRRVFLAAAGAGAGALLAACRSGRRAEREQGLLPIAGSGTTNARQATGGAASSCVGATEDLMREHGVIRRVLVVYREAAARLRTASAPADALQRAAGLIRTFGEDYHEKQLEEANVFPALVKAGGALATTVNTLIAQHQRGREITDYVLAVSRATVSGPVGGPLASSLEAFARMYEEHAALEDTIVFPAWNMTLSPKEREEMDEHFEGIERKILGVNGFEDALGQVVAIEKSFGIDGASMTAPPPPS